MVKFDGPASTLLRTLNSPPFLYGTAWKKDSTRPLVLAALTAGFRAVDTACQPRHYREDLVGDALRDAYGSGVVKREDVFVQTKYTPPAGQDPNSTPYDASAGVEEQIRTSVGVSLRNLRHAEEEGYLDCVLLHSPLRKMEDTLTAWKTLETFVSDRIRALGISNTDLATLRAVWDAVEIKPSVVQNRFYPATGHDVELRRFCREKGIVYQSFWTLTGNPKIVAGEEVQTLAKEAGVSPQVAMYSLAMELDIAPLNGTTNEGRMATDLEDVKRLRNWTFVYRSKWESAVADFKKRIGETE